MKKILFIAAGNAKKASSRVRAYNVAAHINTETKGYRADTVHAQSPGLKERSSSYDVVVFQKVNSFKLWRLMRELKSKGIVTAYDIDDGLFTYFLNGKIRFYHMLQWYNFVLPMLYSAQVVFVGSHQLHEFARKLNQWVVFLPSSVSGHVYQSSGQSTSTEPPHIGWIGNGVVYRDELLRIASVLKGLASEYEFRITLIGALGVAELYQAYENIPFTRLIDEIDWTSEKAAVKLIQEFDFGMMPLQNIPWNRYKCGYKLIQYMACGVIPLADSVGENEFIVSSGWNGWLVREPKRWLSIIEKALQLYYRYPQKVDIMKQRARSTVENRYMYDVNVPILLDALDSAA